MADDNLDSLSNVELRQKMLAQGLPNIPVTDSSRKVLVKRLRASIGGNNSIIAPPTPATIASPKKASRRETINVAAPLAAPVAVDKTDAGANQSQSKVLPKPRSTIAATGSDRKEGEARRPQLQKPSATSLTSSRLPQLAEQPKEKRKQDNSPENTLLINSLIVLESDDEEDEQLARAAQQFEDQYKRKEQQRKELPKPKLTATATSTHEFISKPAALTTTTTSVRVQQKMASTVAPPSERHNAAAKLPTTVAPSIERSTIAAKMAPPIERSNPNLASSYDYAGLLGSGRYSSSTLSQNYIGALDSDDTAEEEEPANNHFESTFARNLERLRNERLGDRSSPYSRRTIATGGIYEPTVRRSLRPEENSASFAFRRWCHSLDRKYNLKPKLFILCVLLLIVGVYFVFY